MNSRKLVAIVGRPNVGKSRLFNRLAHRRIAIVHDEPGVTRDLVAVDMPEGYTLMDTGGIGLRESNTPKIISEAMEAQAMVAINTADIVLFVTDGQEGLTQLDVEIGHHLRQHRTRVVLVVNKLDRDEEDPAIFEFARLGFGNPIGVSAEHNMGLNKLEQLVLEKLAPLEPDHVPNEPQITMALIGKPNAGKSSLGNRLHKSERFIVSEIAGTTRDMIETSLRYTDRRGKEWDFRLFDTAGLRPKRKVDTSVEFFSTVRTERSIEYSDIVLLLIDAREGVSKQDKAIGGQILEAGKALVVVVTKWDLATKEFLNGEVDGYRSLGEFQNAYEASVRKAFFYLPDSPVIFTSATEDKGIDFLLDTVIRLHETLDTRISTPRLNRCISDLIQARAPSKISGKRFKIYYAVQTGNRPFQVKLFCNRAEKLEDTYRRYLEKNISREFDLQGCPFRFFLVGKEERYAKDDE